MRFEDTPELFGVGMGVSTCSDLICNICHNHYNEGNDKTGDYDGDSVLYTDFAGLVVCYACFEAIEKEILHRMPDILSWYKRILDSKTKLKKQVEELLNDK
jgi:hypothetical protein